MVTSRPGFPRQEIGFRDGPALDAFNRQRVTEIETLFDGKLLFDDAPLFWDDKETSGTGTSSTHSTAHAMSTMGVGTAAGTRVRQTFMRFNYQSGKSQLVMMTGVIGDGGGGTGIIRSSGIFDDDNGVFFRDNEGVTEVVIRSSVTGSAVDNNIAQADWNLDTLDGSRSSDNPSGATLDISKVQIFVIDFEWLGSGRVRMGCVTGGTTAYVHEFLHTNINALVYMSTPNLPLRYEISNDGTGVASTLGAICNTVISEGGTSDLGSLRWASTAGAEVVTNAENSIFAVLGIRLKSTHLAAAVKLISAALQLQTASEYAEWMLIFNPTVAGTFTYADEVNSSVQIARGATANTVTNGIQMPGGYVETGANSLGGSGDVRDLNNARLLGSQIDGTPDEIVLCIRPIGGKSAMNVEGGLGWREQS